MILFEVPIFLGFALLGRWMQLYPEKIVPKGIYTGENTFGAKLLRTEAKVIGAFAVLGGTTFALSTALQPLTSGHTILQFLTWSVAIVLGVLAVVYVRKEVRKWPPYKSTSPYGWWP